MWYGGVAILNWPLRQRRERSQLRRPAVAPARARMRGKRTRAYSRRPAARCTRAKAPRGSRSAHSRCAPRPPRPCPSPRTALPSWRKPDVRRGAGRGSGSGPGPGTGTGTGAGAGAGAGTGGPGICAP
eukprot:scaffold13749_cov60-Phaeocystis_antarctica.AAC.3